MRTTHVSTNGRESRSVTKKRTMFEQHAIRMQTLACGHVCPSISAKSITNWGHSWDGITYPDRVTNCALTSLYIHRAGHASRNQRTKETSRNAISGNCYRTFLYRPCIATLEGGGLLVGECFPAASSTAIMLAPILSAPGEGAHGLPWCESVSKPGLLGNASST